MIYNINVGIERRILNKIITRNTRIYLLGNEPFVFYRNIISWNVTRPSILVNLQYILIFFGISLTEHLFSVIRLGQSFIYWCFQSNLTGINSIQWRINEIKCLHSCVLATINKNPVTTFWYHKFLTSLRQKCHYYIISSIKVTIDILYDCVVAPSLFKYVKRISFQAWSPMT